MRKGLAGLLALAVSSVLAGAQTSSGSVGQQSGSPGSSTSGTVTLGAAADHGATCVCSPSAGTPGAPMTPAATAGGMAGAATAKTQSSGRAGERTGNDSPTTSNENATTSGMIGQDAGGSLSANTSVSPIDENGELGGLIQTALRNEPMLTSTNILVEANDSRIILTGSVPTGKQKQAAERVAKSFAINRRVVNHITVNEKQ